MDEVVGRQATHNRAGQETCEAAQENQEKHRHGGRELAPEAAVNQESQETRGGGRGGQERAQRGRR
eukprot:2970692-Heterocapsa_arctica.AAC.1